ncbi:MAG: hypothetical protein R3Y07_02735 [Eubacteriales bacterium]
MNEINYKTAQESIQQKEIGRIILNYVKEIDISECVIEQKALKIVEEITKILQSAPAYPDDQDLVEQIISVLHENGISTGICHDY